MKGSDVPGVRFSVRGEPIPPPRAGLKSDLKNSGAGSEVSCAAICEKASLGADPGAQSIIPMC